MQWVEHAVYVKNNCQKAKTSLSDFFTNGSYLFLLTIWTYVNDIPIKQDVLANPTWCMPYVRNNCHVNDIAFEVFV